tara:strand:+ start:1562 stop:2335 length:774 start_codon:yes stop_codon:yes gene_type:complete
MVTTLLQGGLGNQIFQVCAALSLALENNDEFKLDESTHLLPNQGRKCKNYIKNIFRNLNFSSNLLIKNVYHEPQFNYKKINYLPDLCLVGYFQSEKYFKEYSREVRDLLAPDPQTLSCIKNKYGEILKKNTVALHVRRGDYMNSPEYHPVCTLKYYNQAIQHFSRDSVFLVFSDDIKWCKSIFKGDAFIFVENNEDYVDLYLISLCKHAIIANSSFGWWGAWLNNNKNKMIIAPQTWFGNSAQHNTKDLYCDGWVII